MEILDDKGEAPRTQPDVANDSDAEVNNNAKLADELRHAINQPHVEIYAEALAKYPNDESIDQAEEKKLRRKLDRRIIPLLGICYFFYVSLSPF
jgi:hypothetical protein